MFGVVRNTRSEVRRGSDRSHSRRSGGGLGQLVAVFLLVIRTKCTNPIYDLRPHRFRPCFLSFPFCLSAFFPFLPFTFLHKSHQCLSSSLPLSLSASTSPNAGARKGCPHPPPTTTRITTRALVRTARGTSPLVKIPSVPLTNPDPHHPLRTTSPDSSHPVTRLPMKRRRRR